MIIITMDRDHPDSGNNKLLRSELYKSKVNHSVYHPKFGLLENGASFR